MGRFVEELVRQRQAELARGAGRSVRSRPAAGRRRPTLARRTGRLLVAAGVRLAGPEVVHGTEPLSV